MSGDSDHSQAVSRRKLFQTGAAVAAITWGALEKAATLDGAAGFAGRIWEKLTAADDADTRTPAEERARWITKLLLPHDATDVIPPSHHPRILQKVELPGGGETYAHELAVLRAVSDFLPVAKMDVVRDLWPVEDGHSIVCLGSGASNQVTKELIGDLEQPEFFAGNETEKAVLRYAARKIGGERIRHLQYGQIYHGSNSAIVSSESEILAHPRMTADRTITEDFLLVSRIPGRLPGTLATIFSGLHGPGTRGAETLFRQIAPRDLDLIAEKLGWKEGQRTPYFQAVFRASDFVISNHSFVPTRIEVVEDLCPPVALKRYTDRL